VVNIWYSTTADYVPLSFYADDTYDAGEAGTAVDVLNSCFADIRLRVSSNFVSWPKEDS